MLLLLKGNWIYLIASVSCRLKGWCTSVCLFFSILLFLSCCCLAHSETLGAKGKWGFPNGFPQTPVAFSPLLPRLPSILSLVLFLVSFGQRLLLFPWCDHFSAIFGNEFPVIWRTCFSYHQRIYSIIEISDFISAARSYFLWYCCLALSLFSNSVQNFGTLISLNLLERCNLHISGYWYYVPLF